MAHEDRGRIGFESVFCVHGRQNTEDPNLSPMADDTIAWGSIQGLGSPVYIFVG